MTSLAAETRAAIDEQPFLRMALRAGICNVAAAARYLDVDGEVESIATAIRRYAEDLPDLETGDRNLRVRMEQGVDADVLVVNGSSIEAANGSGTAILATGDLGPGFFGSVLHRLAVAEVTVLGAGMGHDTMIVVVAPRYGATALRLVEETAALPTRA